MPGLIVCVVLPLTLSEPRDTRPVGDGAARPANGSGKALTWVVGVGLSEALPDLLVPPTTSIPAGALSVALPLAVSAVADDELTTTMPGEVTVRLALPDRLSAPPAVGFRISMAE